jgi:hypothetical protein
MKHPMVDCGEERSDVPVPTGLPCDVRSKPSKIFKSDVGALAYDDPVHPHAVIGAGGESFGYDAVAPITPPSVPLLPGEGQSRDSATG